MSSHARCTGAICDTMAVVRALESEHLAGYRCFCTSLLLLRPLGLRGPASGHRCMACLHMTSGLRCCMPCMHVACFAAALRDVHEHDI